MFVLLQTLFFTLLTNPSTASGQIVSTMTVDQLIGINARPQDIRIPGVAARLQKFDHVRSFHRWAEDVGPADSTTAKIVEDWINPPTSPDYTYLRYRYNLSFNSNLQLRMDNFYGDLGKKAFPTLFTVAPAMRGITDFSIPALDQKPVNLKLGHNFVYTPGSFPYDSLVANPANDPKNYRSYTLNLSMFATRYGLVPNLTSIKTNLVTPHQAPDEMYPNALSLHHVGYMEVYNEPDKEWFDTIQMKAFGRTTHKQWGQENAAMLSAGFDGHCKDPFFKIPSPSGQPENYLGIKNISPTTKVVMGGLANLRGKHIESMMDWFDVNRANCSTKIPFDVINYHHYSFKASTKKNMKFQYENEIVTNLFDSIPYAATPEEDSIKLKMRYFALRLKTTKPELASKPVWITEIGYDTKAYDAQSPATAYHQTASGPVFSQRAQAQWDMRLLLEAASSKVMDRISLYEIVDLDFSGLYASSGVINNIGIPKESWYYVQTLRNVLKGLKYQGLLTPESTNPVTSVETYYNYGSPNDPNSDAAFVQKLNQPDIDNNGGVLLIATPALGTNDPKPRIYRFAGTGTKQVYAIWSPTKTDKAYTATVQFKTAAFQNKVTLVTTRNLDENGYHRIWSSNATAAGAFTNVQNIPISETPIFVVLGEEKQDPVPTSIPANLVTVSQGCCSDVKINFPTVQQSKYTIYYASTASYPGTSLDLNNPNIRMYEMPVGATTPVILTGLNLASGSTFKVWIIVDLFDQASATFGHVQTTLPSSISLTVPAVCNSCVMSVCGKISASFSGGLAIGNNIFCSQTTNICGLLTQSTDPNQGINWGTLQPSGPSNTITINWGVPIAEIDMIKYYDGQGQGSLHVEYLGCGPDWIPLTTIDLGQYGVWRDAPGTKINCRALRFWRSGPDAKIFKLLICGKVSTAYCASTPPIGQKPSKIQADVSQIGFDAARVEWTPSWKTEKGSEIFRNYELMLSSDWDKEGKLIDPVIIKSGSIHGEIQLAKNLQNLKAGTNYRGFVQPSLEEISADGYQLIGELPRGSFEFTTLDYTEDVEERSAAPQKQELYQLTCFPNPSSGTTQLNLPETGYYLMEMINMATGQVVQTQKLDESASSVEVRTSEQPNGGYLLRVLHRIHAQGYTSLILVKE
jgi:hypothetical protein